MKQCKSRILAFVCGAITVGLAFLEPAVAALTLTHEGETRYVVAMADDATGFERFAVEELTNFLTRVTGAAFPVVAESALDGHTPAIYLGWTAYAAGHGIDPAVLGEEEWIVRTLGDNLILTGGRPRGPLYAVYEFLEKQAGCYWLDLRTEVVPQRPTLTFEPLDVRDQPRFFERHVGCPHGSPENHWLFLVRNKNYRHDHPHHFALLGERFPEGLFYPLHGSPGRSHTFSYFVNARDWFETHPEYFALVDGQRLPAYGPMGPGQLCLTHPHVLRLTIEKLREFIAQDREEAARKGIHPPRIYNFSQNDKYRAHCQCDDCSAIVEREGGESGPLVTFVNALADAIRPDHPEVLLSTSAYNLTQPPPAHVRPRENVLIRWCDVYSRVDHLRPLNHPYNATHYQEIRRWGEIAPRMGVHDYWTLLTLYRAFPLPWTLLHSMAPDLRLMAECGVEAFEAEAGYYLEPGKNFIDLEFWLAFRLLVDPYQPVEPMIDVFMDGYYGAAAPAMRAYLNYLTARIDADAQFMMYRNAPHNLAYLDLDFFVTSQQLFDEAQAQCEPGSQQAAHVLRERFIIDSALLYLWPWLERRLPVSQTLPFDKEQVIQRYKQGWANYDRQWFNTHYRAGHSHNADGRNLERIAGLFRDPQLPERFRDLPRREVADFNWLTFANWRPSQVFVPDEDAAGGMAATFTARGAIQAAEEGGDATEQAIPEVYRQPVVVGVTGGAPRTIERAAIPADERYHLYDVGAFDVRPGAMVWALSGRRLGVEVDRLFVPDGADPEKNLWQGSISLKFSGPAYVPGSTNRNAVFMDRVLLVRPRADTEAGAALARARAEREQRNAARPRLSVPRLAAAANGDPRQVAWDVGAESGAWSSLTGETTTREVTLRAAHDGEYLYLGLREAGLEAGAVAGEPFAGDHWELLFAAQRGEPYRQIGIGPDGAIGELAYGEASWQSGARVVSEMDGDRWSVYLAFPLDRLLPGGARPGHSVFANILRGGRDPLAWSPTYERNFNLRVDALGELVLNITRQEVVQ